MGCFSNASNAELKDYYGQVAISGDGKQFVTIVKNGETAVIDAETGNRVGMFGHGFEKEILTKVSRVTISADGKQVVTGGEDKRVILWDVKREKRIHTLEGHKHKVEFLAISPDAQLIVSSAEKEVIVWDAVKGTKTRSYEDHPNKVTGLAISGDGKRWVFGSEDGMVSVYDTSKGERTRNFKVEDGVECLSISRNGNTLLIGQRGEKASLWDMDSGKQLRVFEKTIGNPRDVRLSPDGRIAVTGGDNAPVIIWDTQTGKALHYCWASHGWSKYGVWSMSMTTDGKRVAAESVGWITVWDIEKGKEMVIHHPIDGTWKASDPD